MQNRSNVYKVTLMYLKYIQITESIYKSQKIYPKKDDNMEELGLPSPHVTHSMYNTIETEFLAHDASILHIGPRVGCC